MLQMFEHMDYSPLCIRIVCTDMYTLWCSLNLDYYNNEQTAGMMCMNQSMHVIHNYMHVDQCVT